MVKLFSWRKEANKGAQWGKSWSFTFERKKSGEAENAQPETAQPMGVPPEGSSLEQSIENDERED